MVLSDTQNDVNTLCRSFQGKFQQVDMILALRDAHEDDTCINELQQLKRDVESVKILSVAKTSHINNIQRRIEEVQAVTKILIDVKSILTDMVENIPVRLPKHVEVERKPSTVKETSVVSSNQNPSAKPAANKSKVTTAQANQQTGGKQINIYVPEIEFLMIDEFNQVPKYLKGRLSYDQINKFVQGMNTAFQMKYKLLKMKKSTMSDTNRKKYDNYQMQVTKDTKDCYFIVDEDIKEYGGLKMDSSARTTLSILRHCGRVQEVHGGKLTRYVYLDHY